MRIIITGGTGLIGQALSDRLAEDGHEVIVLSRSPQKWTGAFHENVQVVEWDAETSQGWGHLVDGAGAIVNLAGDPIPGDSFFPARWTDERKQRILNSRVKVGQAVVEAVEKAAAKPDVVIQASAIGYYPVGEAKVTEESGAGDHFQAQVCQVWESVTEPVEALGVRQAIIRTGIVLSMESGALPRLVLPFRFFAGGPLGDGKQWTPWIHLEDEVRAIQFLIENESVSGPYNLCVPQPVRNKELAAVIGRVMNRPSFIPVPGLMMRLLFGEVATLVLDGWQAYPERLLEAGFEFKYTQLEEALRDLLK